MTCANCGAPARWVLLPCLHPACWRCAPDRCCVCFEAVAGKEAVA